LGGDAREGERREEPQSGKKRKVEGREPWGLGNEGSKTSRQKGSDRGEDVVLREKPTELDGGGGGQGGLQMVRDCNLKKGGKTQEKAVDIKKWERRGVQRAIVGKGGPSGVAFVTTP